MATTSGISTIEPYEARLRENPLWAWSEGDRYFRLEGAIFETLRKLVRSLDRLGIPHAVAGGLALFAHGYRRLTVDIDLLVTANGLDAIRQHLQGPTGLVFGSGKTYCHDAESGVRVDFLIAGGFPGDGLPKPVAFPDPHEAGVEIGGIRYLGFRSLVELKLASGMTNKGRLRDLADVVEMMKCLHLPAELAQGLNPYVRAKYAELWDGLRSSPVLQE